MDFGIGPVENMNNILNGIGINLSDLQNPELYADYGLAIAVFFITFAALNLIKMLLVGNLKKLAKKTANKLDDTLVEILDGVGAPFYFFFSSYVATWFLELAAGSPVLLVINYLLLISIVYYAVKGVGKLVDYGVGHLIRERQKDEGKNEDVSLIKLSGKIVKVIIWAFALLLFLGNIGLDITPLVAGAGVGGIAIAFGLQSILGDIFASFSIYFDKPFKVGDYVMVGPDEGTVKSIGIKSTRIQALRGEEIVISNKELTNTRINNFKRMNNRRIDFRIGVTYQTSPAKLEKIPKIDKKIIDDVKLSKFDRCHFSKFADSALEYTIVYYVLSRDYVKYMDTQQEINLAIAKAFAKEKIEFAYPTQTIFVQK